MVTLGLVQASACPCVTDNFNTIRQYVSQAQNTGCTAICFPEAFLTGYAPEEAAQRSLRRDAAIMKELADLAQAQQVDLLIGFMEQADDRYFLTQGVWRAEGTADFYRKTHLGTRESEIFSSGDALEVFSLSCGLRIGFQLCVETHFPEITQTYSLEGAEVIFAPHASPLAAEKRRELWEKYIPARSYDNRAYMACCNLWDSDRFGGGCMVTDPRGEVIASSFENSPGLLCFDVDRAHIGAYHRRDSGRNHHYYPGRRRPELYL